MSSKSARESTRTLNIINRVYESYKMKAEAARYQLKEYVNDLLDDLLLKDAFVERMAPHLEKLDVHENRMVIADRKEGKIINVYLRDMELYCDFHQAKDCLHTRFVWTRPDLAKLDSSRQSPKNSSKDHALLIA